ncbi:MAG: DUF5343 domain-containing protein [Nitrososphaerales archaeon]
MAELELVTKEEGVEESFEEAKDKNIGKRNPPARNTSRFWFERFLAVIQRQNPSIIDSSFVRQIAPSNEGKLLAQLKYLHVIDEAGKPTSLLASLNMVGDEQKKAFQEAIRGAYSDLMAEIVIERAVPEDVVNYFIRKYSFTRDKAINAAKFFLYLAEKGSLNLSPELASFLNEKSLGSSPQSGTSNPSKIAERSVRTISQPKLYQKKRDSVPPVQTIINLKLDKDTPKEYWDRILALLGEKSETQEE